MTMIMAQLIPDPDARSVRADLIGQDLLDALAYALNAGAYTSAEIHREATLDDLAHGNGRLAAHAGSTSPCYYRHTDDPDWAIIFNTDCPGDPVRGHDLVLPFLQEQEGEETQ